MIYGSVCSGIEAATVAWHPLGWRPAFFSEIDAFPRAVLAHHYPEVPLHGDFTTIEAGRYEPIDLLVGGTPCQSFSVAGKRLGLDDPRGNLAIEYCRMALRLRPRWFIWENVPDVLSSNGGRDFGAFLGLLGECGYGWAYRILDAQYVRVDGYPRAVPQRRNRLFVIGYLGDWRRAAAVLFEPESLRGDPPPRREAGKTVAGSITSSLGGSDENDARDGRLIAPEIAATLTRGAESAGKGGYAGRRQEDEQNLVAHALRADGFDASEDGTGRGTPLVPAAYRTTGNNGCYETGDVVGALDTTTDSNARIVAFVENQRNEVRRLDVAGALPAIRRGDAKNETLLMASAVRRLTPRECERLQGFPDDYTLIAHRGKPAADGPRYKALGNSMAVNVMRWIGLRIQIAEEVFGTKAAPALEAVA